MRKFLLVSLLTVGLTGTTLAADFNYSVVSQGDWAVLLVRALNLDEGQVLNNYQDFTRLLTANKVAPKDGWKPEQKLTYAEYVGTIGLALIHYNKKDIKSTAGLNGFLSFLDEKIGISIDQLKSALNGIEELGELNNGIDQYLATRQSNEQTENSVASSGNTGSTPTTKGKAATTSSTTLAAAIADLSQALALIGQSGTSPGDYWDVFSKPASPILPY